MGTAVALPFLDAMAPALRGATRAGSGRPPLRLAFAYVPNGIIMQHWIPASPTDAKTFDLPRTLEPVAPYRDDVLLLSGLAHVNGRALGDGPGDHARAAATFLTGVHPKKTAGADIQCGVSVDQIAAEAIGKATRFPSLELGCEDGRQVGNCDSGYSCAYSNNLSWRGPATPNPFEVNPRAVFERLFAGTDASETPAARAKRQRYHKSILDFVLEDTQRLEAEVGPTDRRKLDEYLTAVREIERRIEAAEKQSAQSGDVPEIDKPEGVPVEFVEHVRLMFDLLAIAFQADLTRIATFMICREGSTRSYRELGISDGHHPLTHHRNDPEMMDKVSRINRHHVDQLAYFLGKLRGIQDGDGRLMDHVMLVYGSSISDGNRHLHHDLPVLLAGRGCGTIQTGRHMRVANETPMTNLFLSLLDRMGVRVERFGDSTGKLEGLSEL